MLPTGDEADNMEQSTLNYVFTLFGKGVTQMLQSTVNQQTLIDELRSQNRSLQTQVANLTAALDEVEDRIFVRLQNMQPTVYTREGIPIDDALDTLTSKYQTANEKLNNYQENFGKIDAELSAKVDRDEFLTATSDAQKASESFADLSNAFQALQKDLQKQRQENEDSFDRMQQTIKLQVESHQLRAQINNEEQDLSNYVTKEELNEIISKIKITGAVGAPSPEENDVDHSAVVEFALSGEGPTEEKVQNAYEMLQQKKAALDSNYAQQSAQIAQEMQRLVKIAENTTDNPYEDSDYDEEEDLEEEDVIDTREYRSIGVDMETDDVEEGDIEERKREFPGKRRNIGLTVKLITDSANETERDDDDDDDEIVAEEVEEEVKTSKKTKRGKKKGMKNMIEEMKKQHQALQQGNGNQVVARVDEGKVTQKVLEAVMPRVENLLVDAFSGGIGGKSGLKLERHEAKQLIDQLSLLDSMKTDLKNLRVKIAMKVDRARFESEIKTRITRDEFFNYMYQLFPDNKTIELLAQQVSSNKLPPLKPSGRLSHLSTDQSQTIIKKNGPVLKNPNLQVVRNSKMLSLNNRYLRGNDGKYYLRDLGNQGSAPNNASIFGSENATEADVNGAFDFQPYQAVEDNQHEEVQMMMPLREQTPNDAPC